MQGELLVAPSATTVVLHGDLDLVTVDSLRGLLTKACRHNPRRLFIDITDVQFLDVLSLSAILATADAVRERGGTVLVRGATPSVRRMCAVLNATDVLAADLPLQRTAG